MRRIRSTIRRVFSRLSRRRFWLRTLPFAVGGLFTVAFLSYGGIEAWNYTSSSSFCGTSCHTMPPEYSAYLRSPHARVKCVECHIGRDVITTQVTRKAGDVRHIVLMLTQKYEFPIVTENMRPARESCETCHFPEKFSDDSLREIRHFEPGMDQPQSIYLLMKTGGGSARDGLARGIHWHVESEVYYLPTDSLEQNIPYVRTVDRDGTITEYYDIAADITPDDVAGQHLERMDCITCHNRITHDMPDPEEAIDQALLKGLLPDDLPELRSQAVSALSHHYDEEEEAHAAITGLADFYAENYPALYAERRAGIEAAQGTLEEIYSNMVFVDQKVDWTTHPNNLGHQDFPGCFRCHDGKHLSPEEEAIRLECNLCHAIPAVRNPAQLVTGIEIVRGPEPPSHIHTSWIALHGKVLDSSCAACHEPPAGIRDYTELEGKPPSDGESFCGNSACHANEWEYTGFDSPALESVLARQSYLLQHTSPYLLDGGPRTYEETFANMFAGRCVFCHSGPGAEAGLDLSTYEGLMAGSESGAVLVPGDPEASLLIQRQSGASDHFGQVLDDELEALRAWVRDGAPR